MLHELKISMTFPNVVITFTTGRGKIFFIMQSIRNEQQRSGRRRREISVCSGRCASQLWASR